MSRIIFSFSGGEEGGVREDGGGADTPPPSSTPPPPHPSLELQQSASQYLGCTLGFKIPQGKIGQKFPKMYIWYQLSIKIQEMWLTNCTK